MQGHEQSDVAVEAWKTAQRDKGFHNAQDLLNVYLFIDVSKMLHQITTNDIHSLFCFQTVYIHG